MSSSMGVQGTCRNPQADWRMNREHKDMVGYYIEYSKTKVAYHVLLGNTVVTSVHVQFDEFIPERPGDYYFRELDKATVNCNPKVRLVSNFDWLVA